MLRSLAAALTLAALPFAAGCEMTESIADDAKSKAFEAADTDGNGVLSRPEFAESDLAKQVTGSIDDEFNKLDTDGDNGLSLAEVEKATTDYLN
ncbi:MAG: EF-hand domain-containing protein [Planctomycetota bacterium]